MPTLPSKTLIPASPTFLQATGLLLVPGSFEPVDIFNWLSILIGAVLCLASSRLELSRTDPAILVSTL
jgi:hypothetical protein